MITQSEFDKVLAMKGKTVSPPKPSPREGC